MSNIKLSRNELLRQAKNIRALKDEVDKILKNTGRTYSLLDNVEDVSTWGARNSLEVVRGSARKASNELDLLCNNLYKAVNMYDNKEEELRRLVTINKSSVKAIDAESSKVGVKAISSLNKIEVKSRATDPRIKPLATIADVNGTEINKNIGTGTKVKLTAVSSIGATTALKGLNTINQSIDTLKSAHIENVVGQKAVKSSSIVAVGRRTIKDIRVIGTAIKAGAKIVSVIIGKVSEIVSRIKEIVNKLFDDIAKAVDRITGKGFTIIKDWFGKAKDIVIDLKDGVVNVLEWAVKCVIGNIKSLITCLVVVVNIVVQAVIGIVAALGYLVGMAIGIAPQDNTFSASVEGWRDNTTNFFKWLAPDKDVFNTVQWVGDMLLSCVPIVGDGRDIVEFITGVDMVTGEKLTLTERILTGIFMLLPIVGAKAGREIVTGIFKHADDLLTIIGNKMDELLDGISTMFNKGDEFELAGVPNGSMPTEASTKVQDFISKITGKDKDINISSGSGSKVDDITEGAGNPILKGEGNVGTYKELIDAGKRGDNLTPHHMPSAEYMKNNGVSKNNGISMNMEQPATGGRHRLTDTYGRNMTDAEKANYYSLSPRDALAHDLWNAREIYIQQGKYTSEIRQGLLDVIKRNKSDYPNLFNK